MVNGDSQNTVQNVAMGKPSDRRPGEPVLTKQETIITIGVLTGVFIASAVVFGIICYKKNCCPGIFAYTLHRSDSDELLESDPVSYTLPKTEPKKSKEKPKP